VHELAPKARRRGRGRSGADWRIRSRLTKRS